MFIFKLIFYNIAETIVILISSSTIYGFGFSIFFLVIKLDFMIKYTVYSIHYDCVISNSNLFIFLFTVIFYQLIKSLKIIEISFHDQIRNILSAIHWSLLFIYLLIFYLPNYLFIYLFFQMYNIYLAGFNLKYERWWVSVYAIWEWRYLHST